MRSGLGLQRLAAAVAMVALVAAGCAEEVPLQTTTSVAQTTTSTTTTLAPVTTTTSSTTTTTARRAGPGYGGEVVVGDDQEPPTLNPFAPGGDNFIVSELAQLWTTGVWDIDATTLELIPEVVTELPSVDNGGLTVNDDGTMTVRYQIRDEAVWADGTPITGADFEFTWETLRDIDDPLTRNSEPWASIDSVEAGDKTFSFTMSEPTLLYEYLFHYLIPKHDVAGTDFLADWNELTWISGGPFVFDVWDRGESITFIRNDNYWKHDPATGMQLPYLDKVTFRFIFEMQRLLQAFQVGELDVIGPPPGRDSVAPLEGLDGVEVQVRRSPIVEHLNFQFGELNRNQDSLNRHPEFRKAVAYGIDREEFLQERFWLGYPVLDGLLEVGTVSLGPGSWQQYRHDPDEARRLLAELCAELDRDCDAEPPRIVFSTSSNAEERPRIAQLLQEQLAEVGIEVELQLEDSALFFGETLDYGTWDMGMWAWVVSPGTAGLSVLDVFDPEAPPPEGSNFYRWGTPAVTGTDDPFFDQGPSTLIDEHSTRFAELLDQIRSTVDRDQAFALALEAEAILADQVIIIPVVTRGSVGAVWADRVANYVHNPSQAGDTWNVELWYRLDR